MRRLQISIIAIVAALCMSVLPGLAADNARALARVSEEGAVIADVGGQVAIDIPLSQSVPWRIFTLDQPPRIVIDFSEVDWLETPIVTTSTIAQVNVGKSGPGWSRMVALLREPLSIDQAEMRVQANGAARLSVFLKPTTAEDFRGSVATQPDFEIATSSTPLTSIDNSRQTVAIDPGHGGIDPGAEAEGLNEAHLMLAFARGLKDELLRNGRFNVVMTRETDVFVPLERRMTIARAAGADIFLSLHADALEADAGPAQGVTIYTLSEEVTDKAALRLAERHARNDILAGVDLSAAEDEIAFVLLDLARRETIPRSAALATTLVAQFRANDLALNSRPNRNGGFSVLKAAEMPSVLIELGFLSNETDRDRLRSDIWTRSAIQAIASALLNWSEEDARRRSEVRQ